MKPHLDPDTGRIVLRPEAEFTIYNAMECRDALLEAMRAEGDLEIDLAAVSEMDAAGLQLLLLAKREAEAHGKRLYLTAPGPAVADVMQLCNLTVLFEAAQSAAA